MTKLIAVISPVEERVRRFIADAYHELRTPITALRTFNELLQGGASQDSQARQEFLLESASTSRQK